ncbi:MAG: pyridoxal-dependent decarboxylase, partial [Spirochaetia bacterium]
AAFGGFVLPFLVDAGYQSAEFDFSLPGVWSITIDPHKMGRSAIPAGAILYRDRKTADAAAHQVTYLAGGKTSQRTIVGTRSGASTASVWAVMTHLGKEGYTAIVKKCMDRTMELADRISKIPGFDIVTEPVMNVIGVRHTDIPVQELVQKLRNRRWAVSEFPGFFRIVLMPHVTSAMCEDFLQILSVVSQEMSREE